jgi:hypothetical protein
MGYHPRQKHIKQTNNFKTDLIEIQLRKTWKEKRTRGINLYKMDHFFHNSVGLERQVELRTKELEL